LDEAANHNIIVIVCIWRNAQNIENIYNLFDDELRLTRYSDNVLIPILKATSHHEALGAWSILDNPQEIINWSTKHDNACFDTQELSFPQSSKVQFSMEKVLRFISLHSSTIHNYSKKLVTTDVWDDINLICSSCFNYFIDACLQVAGTESNGILDFYSLKSDVNSDNCLIRNTRATGILVDKPIVISGCYMYKKEGEIYKQAQTLCWNLKCLLF
jgi:mannan endo-1,4-beta-mannosidase